MRVEVRGLVELQEKTDQMIEDLHGKPMLTGMRRATMLIANEAKRLSPVDQGELRASITPDVQLEGRNVLGIVGSNKLQAPFMELGTKPHWPPISAIETWARRHGLNPFLVARAISIHGTKPRRFLQGAFEAREAAVINIIGEVVTEIVEK